MDVAEELLNDAVQHRPAPDDGRIVAREKRHRHELNAALLRGNDLPRSSPVSCVLMPSIIGTFGPYTSPSIMATRLPIWLSDGQVDGNGGLATRSSAPTAMMFLTPGTGAAASTFAVDRTARSSRCYGRHGNRHDDLP